MSKKGENIRKRKDGRWEGRYRKGYQANGRLIYGSVYGKTYSEVKRKVYDAIQNPPVSQVNESIAEMTFGQLLTLWQQSNGMRLKGGTQWKYSGLIDAHIRPGLGSYPLSQITAAVINAFLTEKLCAGRLDGKGGLSAGYVRSIAIIISSVMKYGANEDLCPILKNKICKPSIVKKELPILSKEAQRTLEKSIRNNLTPTGVGIMISLYTGLRIGEICALQWEDLDLTAKTIHVRHTVSRVKSGDLRMKTKLILDEPKTLSSKRIIPIPSPLLPLLLEYQSQTQSSFVASNTESFLSPRTYDARFHRMLADCCIEDINYHALRHTFATRCVEAGVDVKSLSEILGHSNVSITMNTYVHSSLEMKKSQLEKLVSLSA